MFMCYTNYYCIVIFKSPPTAIRCPITSRGKVIKVCSSHLRLFIQHLIRIYHLRRRSPTKINHFIAMYLNDQSQSTKTIILDMYGISSDRTEYVEDLGMSYSDSGGFFCTCNWLGDVLLVIIKNVRDFVSVTRSDQ